MGKHTEKTHSGRLGLKLIRTVIVLVTLVFAAFFVIVAVELFQTGRRREIDNQRSQITQTAGRIQSLQSTIRSIASLIVYNDVVQKGIVEDSQNLGDELYSARKISDTLKEYLHIVEGTDEITIYTWDGQTLTSRYVRGNLDPERTVWLRDFLASGKSAGFTGVHSSVPQQSGYTTDVFSYITGYYSLENYRERLGELIINVEYQTLLDMISIDTTMLKGYALYNAQREVLVQSGTISGAYGEILDGMQEGVYLSAAGDIYVASTQMEDGWVLLSEISGSGLVRHSLIAILPIFAVFVIMLLVLVFVLRYRIRRVTEPINELSRAAGAVGHGDFSVSVDSHTGDEVEDLARAFNKMVVDINALIETSVEHEKKIQQMQTENLMLQINPHFIYNTMNSIVYMAKMQGNTQIADFTNAFISLLQHTLRVRDSVFTTLGEELQNVQSYLFLQEYRYGNKFSYAIDCPEELKDCRIISVMLQPVVENAIFHGLAPKEGTGQIRIRAQQIQAGQCLRITVSDDGVGMPAQTLAQIVSEDYVQKGGVHKIGIGNVRARIREVYGDPYTLRIDSHTGEGTTVTIDIPYIAEHDKEVPVPEIQDLS